MLKYLIFEVKRKAVDNEINRLREKFQEQTAVFDMLKHKEMGEDALVISDIQEICDWCVENKVAVIAYLHEENKNNDFFKVKYAIEDFEGLDYQYFNKVYQRYHEIPWKILETKRCIVREMTVEDVDALYSIYSDSTITLFLEQLFQEKEKEIEYIANYIEYIYHFFEYGMWVVENKENHQLIGRAGIEWKEGGDRLELGYVIAKPYQRQGIAYEVCSSIITYVRENITSQPLYILTEWNNLASVKLAEKLNFDFEKEEKDKEKTIRRYILRD